MPRASRRKDMPECRRPNKNIRQIEIGSVQQIESFRAELQSGLLPELRVLHERKVNGLIGRSLENIAPRISEAAEGRNAERLRVEPKIGAAFRENRIADNIRT